jgi:hypothetical protein
VAAAALKRRRKPVAQVRYRDDVSVYHEPKRRVWNKRVRDTLAARVRRKRGEELVEVVVRKCQRERYECLAIGQHFRDVGPIRALELS